MSADEFSNMTERLGLRFLLRFYFIPDFREVIFQKLENNEKPYDIKRWYMHKYHGVFHYET